MGTNDILAKWLDNHQVIDKDEIVNHTNKTKMLQNKKEILDMKPEARLDLHGFHQDEAWERLTYFISDCMKRGIRKVIVVHGKGIHTTGTNPVLGDLVKKFIQTNKHCGMSGHPKTQAEGGSGATWIILK